jgi:signal transduction histidine kinase
MRRGCPFAVKLGFSFVIVILVSVALVYFLNARAITTQFATYREQSKQQAAQQVCGLLAEYRLRNDTWHGIEQLLSRQYSVFLNGQWIVRRSSLIGSPFLLADEEGRVVVSTEEDRVGTFLSVEEAASGIVITSGEEKLGTLLLEQASGFDPAEEEFLASAKRSALVGGGIASGVALLLSVVLISQVLSPLRLLSRGANRIAQGDFAQRVVIKARDEFGRLGESFNRMIDNLRHSETVRQNMTADIAHELRTPVTIIQSNLEAILDEIYEPTAETLAPIYEESLHLGRLIDDLRELSLAEAGELRLDKEPTDLAALTRQVAEAIFSSIEEGPHLRLNIESDLPQVELDPKRIRQVLANLLSNALRYTPAGEEIEVSLARRGSEMELRVSDRGPGIPPEDLPHIFERFYRGDRARSRTGGGSGLGLPIAKQWVEAHGGRIHVENNPERGASFIISLLFA